MVSVRAPRACGNHGAAADFTGEAVLTGMGFVIVFLVLFPFVLTVHGVFPPKGKFGFPFGRNAEILRLPPGQRTISCLTYFFKKRCSFFCFAVSSLFAVMIPPCGQLFKYPAHWRGLHFPVIIKNPHRVCNGDPWREHVGIEPTWAALHHLQRF